MSVSDALLALVSPRVDAPTREWIGGVVDALYAPFDARPFRAEWARVGRRTGSHPIELTAAEADAVREAGMTPFVGWSLDEATRAALLARALEVAEPETHGALLAGLYLRGTIRERQALLRVLPWLPDSGRFVDLATEGARTHVVSVFEAIALGNPYPARWFARPIFEQLVQKALALRVPAERIVGVADRLGPASVRPRAAVRPTPHPALPALLAP